MTSSLAPTSQVYPLPDKFATTNTSLFPNAFKSPLFLAKNILRNQACCVSSRGKTPRYLTTLEISLPSMDHNLTHMQMKCWKRKDTDSSSMQMNLPKFNNLPSCGVTEKKIQLVFHLVCSCLILPCSHRSFFHKFPPN